MRIGDNNVMHGGLPPTVCAIVVSCNPEQLTFRRLLAALRPQVAEIVVVDNASDVRFREWLRCNANGNIRVCELPENVGVGAAHNLGIGFAKSGGHSHVLLLDHDSIPDSGMVPMLLAKLRQLASHERVAAVGPSYRDPRTNKTGAFIRIDRKSRRESPCNDCVPVDFLITSGTLIPMTVLEDVGEFDTGLFVDYVDTEWCARATTAGYRLFGVPPAIMRHTIGDNVTKSFGIAMPDYSPTRLYYQARNAMLLNGKHRSPLFSRRRTALRLLRLLGVHGLLHGPRWKNLAMIVRGIRDGRAGRDGRIDVANCPEVWETILRQMKLVPETRAENRHAAA